MIFQRSPAPPQYPRASVRYNMQPTLSAIGISGVQIDMALGTIGYFVPPNNLSIGLIGVSLNTAAGSFTAPGVSIATTTGVSWANVAGLVGVSIATNRTLSITGNSVSVASGLLSSAPFTVIVGESFAAVAGNITVSSVSDLSLFLTNVSMSLVAGNLSADVSSVPLIPWVSPGVDIRMRPITLVGFSEADDSTTGVCYQNEAMEVIGFVFLQDDLVTIRNITGYHGWVTFWYRGEDVHLVRSGFIDGMQGRLLYTPQGDEFYKPGIVYFQATISAKDMPDVIDLAYFKASSRVTRRRVLAAQ